MISSRKPWFRAQRTNNGSPIPSQTAVAGPSITPLALGSLEQGQRNVPTDDQEASDYAMALALQEIENKLGQQISTVPRNREVAARNHASEMAPVH